MAASGPPSGFEHEIRWYTEHTALVITTLKWALLGVVAGLCVGFGTRIFLWALAAATAAVGSLALGGVRYYDFLPVALPVSVWLTRRFAPTARGHGTEAVIAAVHRESGRIDWRVAPIKLAATILTLACGGSVGKEGPCAQIGAAITSLFADCLRLPDEDRLFLPLNPSRCSEDWLRPFVLGSEGHPAWTQVFRVEFQTQGGGRPRRTASDRPTGDVSVAAGTARRPEGFYAAWRV